MFNGIVKEFDVEKALQEKCAMTRCGLEVTQLHKFELPDGVWLVGVCCDSLAEWKVVDGLALPNGQIDFESESGLILKNYQAHKGV